MPIDDLESIGIAPQTDPDFIQLGKHLEANGIMQKWLAEKVNRAPSWVTGVLQGEIPLSDKMKLTIEDALSSTNFKFKNTSNEE